MPQPTLHAQTPSRQRLIALCSRLGFGRIEHLLIREGDPVFDPAPSIILERKLGAEPCRLETSANFTLKPVVLELLQVLDEHRSGRINCLEVRHGLPFRLEMHGDLAA